MRTDPSNLKGKKQMYLERFKELGLNLEKSMLLVGGIKCPVFPRVVLFHTCCPIQIAHPFTLKWLSLEYIICHPSYKWPNKSLYAAKELIHYHHLLWFSPTISKTQTWKSSNFNNIATQMILNYLLWKSI